ncbi:alpha/beta hydrolase family protein [Halomarina oriensis]|uniref:Prolyl oligopeptidase family serine peptidase n=1 Tax=Halomarina oriensis TaxID=671145 RepID=A0A6B0GIZ8_9EURY|nr:CocE/NonD family hydrolase [Halomarina oriensis]MWG34610.1 prolyl oligopeptidase family serine peptidase [Halomarina oriensis]
MDSTRREFLTYSAMVAAGVGLFSDRGVGAAPQADGEFAVTDSLDVESFDGTTIEATLFEPAVDGEVPAILMTHGWGGTRADRRPLAEFYASNGYVVLTYDSRGFGDSGGEVGVDGPNEVGDVVALLTWLAGRESVQTDGPENPRVGMDGYSYGAGIQLQSAITEDRLDALVPRWAWHDLRFSNDPNRVLKWAWFFGLYQSGIANGEPNDRFLDLSRQAVENREASPELRRFWETRSPVGKLGRIETPTLLVSGWEDRLFTPNEAFANYRGLRDTGTDTRLVLYDFGHDFVDSGGPTPTQTQFADTAALAWFDQHLKDGEDADVAPVTLYRSQSETFEEYDALPDGADPASLGTARPGRETRLHGDDADGVSFDFHVREGFDLVGTPRCWLDVTPHDESGSSAPHLFGALYDVAPSGEATLLKDQVAATLVEDAGLLAFDLVGVERHVAAGHTLRLSLTLNDDALVESAVPFEDGLHVDSDPEDAVTVHHSRTDPSTLAVPTLDGPVELAGRPGQSGTGNGKENRKGGESGENGHGKGTGGGESGGNGNGNGGGEGN